MKKVPELSYELRAAVCEGLVLDVERKSVEEKRTVIKRILAPEVYGSVAQRIFIGSIDDPVGDSDVESLRLLLSVLFGPLDPENIDPIIDKLIKAFRLLSPQSDCLAASIIKVAYTTESKVRQRKARAAQVWRCVAKRYPFKDEKFRNDVLELCPIEQGHDLDLEGFGDFPLLQALYLTTFKESGLTQAIQLSELLFPTAGLSPIAQVRLYFACAKALFLSQGPPGKSGKALHFRKMMEVDRLLTKAICIRHDNGFLKLNIYSFINTHEIRVFPLPPLLVVSPPPAHEFRPLDQEGSLRLRIDTEAEHQPLHPQNEVLDALQIPYCSKIFQRV